MTDTPAAPPTKTRPGDQPLPVGGRECVQDALVRLIEERKQLGIQRYGSPLMTHNGRDAGRDMVEEALDLTVYAMQVALELRDLRATLGGSRIVGASVTSNAAMAKTCDASAVGAFGILGPCTLRADHDGPVHRGPNGETWAPTPTSADTSDPARADRRDSLGILLSRAERAGLTADEAALLRQHVETEIRDTDTSRAVAAGNLRHVRILIPELEQAQTVIAQVRATVAGVAQTTSAGISDYDIGRYELAVEILTAIDGTKQPTT